jgi:predicted RNA-binding protein
MNYFENIYESIEKITNNLSDVERSQLGNSKQLSKGKISNYKYPTEQEWETLRDVLVQRSQKSNPTLDPELTAYTPGETLKLFEHPKIKKWHNSIANFKVPDNYGTIIFVPCAKTKPWACATRGIYKSYNEIVNMVKSGEIDPVYFVTISEPLGIVPQDKWSDFPQYDNPGLFKDDAQRSGLFTRDWEKYGFNRKLIVPFDGGAYNTAIKRLSDIISKFMTKNKDKRFLAFVDDFQGLGTHSDMLNHAQASTGIDIQRHFKREKTRTPPTDYILKNLKP